MSEKFFEPCEVCGADQWKIIRNGPVRDGAFGRLTPQDAVMGQCGTCGVERLAESFCHDDSFYSSSEYRNLLAQGDDATSFFAEHDHLQIQKLSVLWPESVRNKVVVDIGCGAGSFLDHVSGLAKETIAIEPCEGYHDSLLQRGHKVYSTAAVADVENVDFAFSFSVIEHVDNPRLFLADIATMLGKNGRLLVSTPNRRDALMDLLPEEYPEFFYRTVHRWYFDTNSFARCAELAGLRITQSRCIHRFGLSNAMNWLRDRKPRGSNVLPHLASPMLDNFWKSYLEQNEVGDYLYFWLVKV